LIFEKNANFFVESCRKSQKIVIITSTPGHPASDPNILSISCGSATRQTNIKTSFFVGGKNLTFVTRTGLPDGMYIFQPKIKIWVHFGGPWNGKGLLYSLGIWNILRPFGTYYGHSVI
jgi:hypothetical protein